MKNFTADSKFCQKYATKSNHKQKQKGQKKTKVKNTMKKEGCSPRQPSTKPLLPEKFICWLVMWYHDHGAGSLLPVQNVQY